MAKEASARTGSKAAAMIKFTLLAVFVLTRALHPLLIDWSKQGGKILYGKNTPVVMNKICTVCIMNSIAFAYGGFEGVKLCWEPKRMVIFGMIGALYALGDFLEMTSMSSLSGGVYQTLLQSKLLITALMLWYIKGHKQTSLQWHVLFSMFLAMSSFVIMDQNSQNAKSTSGSSGFPPLSAVGCVMLKVTVSCYCAVLSEKYLKAFGDIPLYAKISGISTTWAIISFIMCTFEPGVRANGFFANWNYVTCFVTLSFVVKTSLTMSLLQALDSVQKNIGEALAVLAIYVSQAAIDASFELSGFLVAALVVALVKTYGISGQKAKPAAPQPRVVQVVQRVDVVSLIPEGTATMKGVGVSTVLCHVSEDLPQGIFYGMLGDAHPVCGYTREVDRKSCELMLLNRELSAKGVDAPFLPRGCLTVMGTLRQPLPKEALTSEHVQQLAEEARDKILALCMGSPAA